MDYAAVGRSTVRQAPPAKSVAVMFMANRRRTTAAEPLAAAVPPQASMADDSGVA